MKPIKIFLLLTCYLWVAGQAIGTPVNSETAAATVKGWLQLDHSPLGEPLGGGVKSVETFRDDAGLPLYHVVYLDPSGFVIVSGEDQVEPIIAFATKGRFDPSLKNPLGALVGKDIPARVARVRAQSFKVTAAGLKARDKWQKLQKIVLGGPQPLVLQGGSIDDLRVAPFVQTLWNQWTADNTSTGPACYNYFTPPYAAGTASNSVCGCVATALAQLMYYFQYPSVGVGTPSFTITYAGVEMTRSLRGGDGHGDPYQWNQMTLVPGDSDPSAEYQAIGALTADAGVAVHMQYTLDNSGAYMSDAQSALTSTFQFNNAVITEAASINVGYNFIGMVNPNLDARLPVILGIIDTSGNGHCVLADGYGYSMVTLYHHLNMGWGGDDNAWYALPIIDTSDNGTFLTLQSCVYNIYTNGSGEIISGRVVDVNTNPIAGASVTATRSGGGIYTAVTDVNGVYALPEVPSSSAYTVTVTSMGYFPASSNYSTTLSFENNTNSGNVWGANFTLVEAVGPPMIGTQPDSQSITVGSSATFAVIVTNGLLPLAYQWQCQPVGSATWINLSDGPNYSGSATASLTVIQPPLTNSGESFQCVITNAFGGVTSSPPAVLVVNVAPFISITTLAGMAGASGSTDGSNGAALFNHPLGIAVDAKTNVYVADMYNNVIRKLALAGTNWVSSTIAGLAGNPGSADGSYTNARFNGPYGVAVDSGGNVYVADTGSSTIRKLALAGTNWVSSTIAGLAGSPGSADGNNSSARFRYPRGLVVDGSGNIYVADEGNSIIREITPSGANWTVNTIAGLAGNGGSTDGNNNNAKFNEPSGITVDASGNVYVTDMLSCTIRKLVPTGGNWVVSTIAGQASKSGSADGIGSAARFNSPTGVAVDSGGNVFVADEANNTIRRLTPAGTNYTVFTVAGLAGNGNAGDIDGFGSAVRFNGPYGIAVDSCTNVYVADSINNTIRGTPLSNPPPAPAVVQLVKQIASGSALTLTWSAKAGHTYQVQYKTNINQPVWVNLPAVTMTNSAGAISIPIGTDPQRYYRVVQLQ